MTDSPLNLARGPVLLLGGHGMLGQCWRRRLDALGIKAFTPQSGECDFLDPDAFRSRIDRDLSLVINAAAYTDVDGAESDEALATEINGAAVGRLANACRDAGVPLVHYSTDYVFRGDAASPYLTDTPRDPINAYGRSKAAGEEAIERSGVDALVIRTSWLYAPHGANFVRTIAKACAERDSLRVVNDQRGRPTSAPHLVDTTVRLLNAGARGVFHGCDDGECTWHEFATAIAHQVNPSCRVDPCTSEEFPRPAARPQYSVLDLSKTLDAIGPLTHWRDALAETLDQLTGERSAA